MSYPGGKNGSGVAQRLINLQPPHRVYIEPFLGGGAVMRLKRPAVLNIGIDLVALSELPILELPRAQTPESALSARGRTQTPESAIAAEPATFSEASSFKLPSTPATFSEASSFKLPSTPATFSEARSYSLSATPGDTARPRFEFYQGDGIGWLETLHFSGDELVYCDPPYLPTTRPAGRRLYKFEMTNADHRRLLRVIRELPCMVMISGYWSQMYNNALKSWNVISYETMTRGGPAVEYLWFNFPPPVALHDYRYLGEGFRERERLKRQKARWTARLLRMPPLQRQALLAAIAETDFSSDARSTSAVSGERIR